MTWNELNLMVELELRKHDMSTDEVEISYIDISLPREETVEISVDAHNQEITIFQ